MGFISLKKKCDLSCQTVVLPQNETVRDIDMTDMSRGMTESEETVKRGHDFSDVSDVREYIPGDKLMSIHWKLSAKRDILMVKDRVSMSDQQMVVLVDLSGSDEEIDEIVNVSYGLISTFVREQTYVKLLWWSEGRALFDERQIMSPDDLSDAYEAMYYETIYKDLDRIKGYMLSIHPELKAYVMVCMNNGEADAIVVEQE